MKLNTLFQDGAVFQRNHHIPVWGRGEALHKLKADFGGTETYTHANASGEFRFYLPPFDAGGPYTLVVTDVTNGETVTVNDILVGDVWIASGQSNMSYLLESNWANTSVPYEELTNCKQMKEFCATIPDSARTRFFMVEQCASGCLETDAKGTWMPMDAEHAPKCTAVGAWFGRYIQEALGVPVGIIGTAWGGTIAEAWTSQEALLTNPATADSVMQVRSRMENEMAWDNNELKNQILEITQPDPGNEGEGWGWAAPDFNDYQWPTMTIPGSWIGQQIAGNGAVWVRKKVIVPREWAGKNLVLVTGGIDKHDISYFNGVEIGRTGKDLDEDVWNKPRHYTIPGNLVKAGENTIAIRAFSHLYEGCFWGTPTDYYLQLEGADDARLNISGAWFAKAEYDWGNLTSKLKGIGYGQGNPNTPGILFGGMINPLLPYAIRGAVWYQGESNTGSIACSASYLKKLETMIADWRYRWGVGDFPFIQVQLANYMDFCNYDETSNWAVLREAQRVICNRMNHVYMISALDIGEAGDIHPQDKKTVGKRLADCALANEYGMTAPASGPMFRGVRQEQHCLRVFFDYARGLRLTGDGAACFCLFDASGKAFIADKAVIEGETVLLSADECAVPVAVRYAWANNPSTALVNDDGLPASSFSSRNEF